MDQMIREISERSALRNGDGNINADVSQKPHKPQETPGSAAVMQHKDTSSPRRTSASAPKESRRQSGLYQNDNRRKRPLKRSDNPDVIYGRDFEDEPIKLETVTGEMGVITFRGQVMSVDKRQLKSGKFLLIFDVTDFTDSITVKLFLEPDDVEELEGSIKKGVFLKNKGRYQYRLVFGRA